MPAAITFQMDHPSHPPGRIEGFKFLWAFYVNGYRPETHCQPGLKGQRVDEFCTPTARSGTPVTLDKMDRYPYVYLCGVAAVPDHERGGKNLHLPMRYKEGGLVEATTYNGYTIVAQNAEAVPIPALPDDWNGLPRKHARCKNFQFAVAAFGWPPA